MKRRALLTSAPHALRTVQLDNIAIVPASLLPAMERWQALANELPRGSVLIACPNGGRQTHTLQRVAQILAKHGRKVRLITEPLTSPLSLLESHSHQ